MAILDAFDIPSGSILSMEQIAGDEQLAQDRPLVEQGYRI
ncbi:crotonobetainyl-CoA:carnitine CoA-transferase CaiB-like acyl-CoA transferase [Bradyrhizobium sp. USDA 4369]